MYRDYLIISAANQIFQVNILSIQIIKRRYKPVICFRESTVSSDDSDLKIINRPPRDNKGNTLITKTSSPPNGESSVVNFGSPSYEFSKTQQFNNRSKETKKTSTLDAKNKTAVKHLSTKSCGKGTQLKNENTIKSTRRSPRIRNTPNDDNSVVNLGSPSNGFSKKQAIKNRRKETKKASTRDTKNKTAAKNSSSISCGKRTQSKNDNNIKSSRRSARLRKVPQKNDSLEKYEDSSEAEDCHDIDYKYEEDKSNKKQNIRKTTSKEKKSKKQSPSQRKLSRGRSDDIPSTELGSNLVLENEQPVHEKKINYIPAEPADNGSKGDVNSLGDMLFLDMKVEEIDNISHDVDQVTDEAVDDTGVERNAITANESLNESKINIVNPLQKDNECFTIVLNKDPENITIKEIWANTPEDTFNSNKQMVPNHKKNDVNTSPATENNRSNVSSKNYVSLTLETMLWYYNYWFIFIFFS
jgi:hypothetical protein